MWIAKPLAAGVLVCLVACGGGDGSSAPSSPQPTVTLSSTDLTQQVLYVENQPLTVTPAPTAFTFTNFVNPPNVKLSAGTPGGINSLSFTMADASHGGITLTLRAPSSLAQATYDTPITVKVYADSTGDILVDTFTVTLHYTVTNSYTVSGANGYTITALPVTAAGLAGNSKQNVIYAAVLADPATNAYSVEALDPSTGASLYAPVPGVTPGVLALSDDGQFLYANVKGVVERLQASSLALNLTLPTDGADGLAVVPGLPHTVAVASSTALKIFDDAVARANSVPVPSNCGPSAGLNGSYSYIQWGSQSALYATVSPGNCLLGPAELCPFAVDGSGVTANGSCAGAEPSAMTFADGLGYAPGGQIFNPAGWTVVRTLSVPQSPSPLGVVAPDTTLGVAFAFASSNLFINSSASCSIQSFNLGTGTPIASVRLPNISDPYNGDCLYYGVQFYNNNGAPNSVNSLVRFGTNGIALSTDPNHVMPGYIIVITGAFVAP
jgi:hypothetical protein